MFNLTTRRLLISLIAVTAALSVAACGGSGGGIGDSLGGGSLGDTVGGDEHTGEPVKGKYEVSGTWDMSSPISSERTLGDVFVEALILQLADSIPSDSAVEKLDEVVRPTIKSEIDGLAPPVLRPDSELMQSLAGTLASVDVMSELDLEDGGLRDDLSGSEKIVAFGFHHEGETTTVTPEELSMEPSRVYIAATWEAQAQGDGSSIEVDAHPFELRFGELVEWVVTNSLEAHHPELAQEVSNALACNTIVERLLGGGEGLFVTVAGEEYGFDAEHIGGACEAVRGTLVQRALGLFALDAKVVAGGTVRFIDEDGDGKADILMSGENYGGHIAVAPEYIAPRLAVQFEAVRVP